MIKLLGNVVLLALLYGAILAADPGARTAASHFLLAQRIGLAGIIALGAGTLIITGGIDLSIGSVVAVCEVVFYLLLVRYELPPALAMLLVLLVGVGIGLIHGVLVTYVRLQAFIVTLCGLFIYRGISRWLAGESALGMGSDFVDLKDFFSGGVLGIPVHFVILAGLALLIGTLLHFSVHGRYAFAIGSNENAARYCGIRTDVYKLLAYVLCSTLAAAYGLLNFFKMNAVQPSSTGNFLELYAIAAAVIGGCSLRGGEGTVLGILMGTCIITLLPSYVSFMGMPDQLEYPIVGGALLLGALIDEMLRRYYGGRKT